MSSLRPVFNPPNPWLSQHSELLEPAGPATVHIWEQEAKSFLNANSSPDVSFKWSGNPYRGCAHACAYCFARPTHQYLGYGAGTDFETQLVVKINAPSLLRQELNRPSWKGEVIVFSGNTDCYQPLEASYGLTRACLELCLDYHQPVSIITKGALIRRDVDLLAQLSRVATVHVNVSIAFSDDGMAKLMEPGTPSPTARFETIRQLAAAGVSVGVGIAPVIPGLNESQIPAILEKASAAGARFAFRTLLRLPAEVEDVFIHTLEERFPTHAAKVLSLMKQMRGGKLYDSQWGQRMVGSGANWQAADDLFKLSCKKLGLKYLTEEAGHFDDFKKTAATFRRPKLQGDLFDP
jgi:DNA repair photolyase